MCGATIRLCAHGSLFTVIWMETIAGALIVCWMFKYVATVCSWKDAVLMLCSCVNRSINLFVPVYRFAQVIYILCATTAYEFIDVVMLIRASGGRPVAPAERWEIMKLAVFDAASSESRAIHVRWSFVELHLETHHCILLANERLKASWSSDVIIVKMCRSID